MSNWVAIPCLLSLQKEFDQINPSRDKGAEGFIGDASHTSSSDHTPDEDSDKLRNKDADHINEVHAYDCDSSGPWNGNSFDAMVKEVIRLEKLKWNDPNDKCRLNYVIWDHHIYDKDNNFEPEIYTATSDPHVNHAHFSGRYETSCENDTRPWGIVDKFGDDLPVEQATFDKLMINSWKNQAVVDAFLDNVKITDYVDSASPQRKLSLRQWIGYTEGRAQVNEAIEVTKDVQSQVAEIDAKLDAHISGLIEGNK